MPGPDLGPNVFARRLFAGLPGRYDMLAEVLSFGQNGRWRREMVARAVAGLPSRVLDVATGTAGVAIQLSARSGAHVTGLDLTPEMLRTGAARVAASRGSHRVCLVLGRGEQLPFPDATFDALSFTYLFRYVSDPLATLHELARVVRPGGHVASLEFAVPEGSVRYALWRAYTSAVLPFAGLALGGREWYEVGRFLPGSIISYYRHYPVSWHLEAWRLAGFEDVAARVMSFGAGIVMSGRKGTGGATEPR